MTTTTTRRYGKPSGVTTIARVLTDLGAEDVPTEPGKHGMRCIWPDNHSHGDRRKSAVIDNTQGTLTCYGDTCLDGKKLTTADLINAELDNLPDTPYKTRSLRNAERVAESRQNDVPSAYLAPLRGLGAAADFADEYLDTGYLGNRKTSRATIRGEDFSHLDRPRPKNLDITVWEAGQPTVWTQRGEQSLSLKGKTGRAQGNERSYAALKATKRYHGHSDPTAITAVNRLHPTRAVPVIEIVWWVIEQYAKDHWPEAVEFAQLRAKGMDENQCAEYFEVPVRTLQRRWAQMRDAVRQCQWIEINGLHYWSTKLETAPTGDVGHKYPLNQDQSGGFYPLIERGVDS